VSTYTPEALAECLNELANFRHYPPERSSIDGRCFLCSTAEAPQDVPAGTGVVVLGGKDGRNYATHLHHKCAAIVRKAQEDEWARRKR